MAFFVDQLVKIAIIKVFGTSKPIRLTAGTSNDEVIEDPYFEPVYVSGSKEDVKLERRKLSTKIPLEKREKIGKIVKFCYLMDESLFGLTFSKIFRKRRLGVGIQPILKIFPVIGNYFVLIINLIIFYKMVEISNVFKKSKNKGERDNSDNGNILSYFDVTKMLGNILIDFGIGFIPFVGLFIGIIQKCNSRNLMILLNKVDARYHVEKKAVPLSSGMVE